jgi:hypothetical protein
VRLAANTASAREWPTLWHRRRCHRLPRAGLHQGPADTDPHHNVVRTERCASVSPGHPRWPACQHRNRIQWVGPTARRPRPSLFALDRTLSTTRRASSWSEPGRAPTATGVDVPHFVRAQTRTPCIDRLDFLTPDTELDDARRHMCPTHRTPYAGGVSSERRRVWSAFPALRARKVSIARTAARRERRCASALASRGSSGHSGSMR